MYGLSVATGPTAEPVDLDAAKAHLRVDQAADDRLIARLVTAAREMAEEYTARRFVTQSLMLTLPGWPCDPAAYPAVAHWPLLLAGYPFGWWLSRGEAIGLPVAPVSAVAAVRYYDTAGTQQTAAFQSWLDHLPPLVAPAAGSFWPVLQRGRLAPVEVEFTAGYGGPEDVPARAGEAILIAVGYWYENRGDGKDPAALGLPAGACWLLDSLSARGYR